MSRSSSQGQREGHAEGRREGLVEGASEMLASNVLAVLKARGIEVTSDLAELRELFGARPDDAAMAAALACADEADFRRRIRRRRDEHGRHGPGASH